MLITHSTVPFVLPPLGSICQTFARSSPIAAQDSTIQRTKYTAREDLYTSFSTTDDAKNKANQLSDAATKEFEKASASAQAKAGKIELYTPKFYAASAFGGLLACGVTHTAVTPLDLVKCRRQVDSNLYKGNFEAWGKIGRAEGFRGIFTGWSPTFFGYSVRSFHGCGNYLRV